MEELRKKKLLKKLLSILNESPTYTNLLEVVRSYTFPEEFVKTLNSDINDSELMIIINKVKKYLSDNLESIVIPNVTEKWNKDTLTNLMYLVSNTSKLKKIIDDDPDYVKSIIGDRSIDDFKKQKEIHTLRDKLNSVGKLLAILNTSFVVEKTIENDKLRAAYLKSLKENLYNIKIGEEYSTTIFEDNFDTDSGLDFLYVHIYELLYELTTNNDIDELYKITAEIITTREV